MGALRIAIDVGEVFSPIPGGGGQGRVIRILIRELTQLDWTNRYTLFSIRRIGELPEEFRSLPENFRIVQIPSPEPRLLFLAWHLLRWPVVERFIGPQDIVHATSPNILPPCRGARVILTVHDLVWWRFPQGLKAWGRFFLRRGLLLGAREAVGITTVSECTRRDVLAYLSGRIEPERVCTIYNGIESDTMPFRGQADLEAVARRYGVHKRYILSIGTIEPRKNLHRLLQAYSALPGNVLDEVQLVIIGPFGWKMPSMMRLIKSLRLEEHVIWTGHVPDEHRDVLLSGAVFLVYPSLYEGFGLPVLEAMACGVPVITSNVSSMPEIAGDAALLVDPMDIEALSGAMTQLFSDAEMRQVLVARGHMERQRFSSKRMASEFLALYKSTAAGTAIKAAA